MKSKKFFFEFLVKWNNTENKRVMPWKGEKDPYKIWVSEIILQQTRVQQGLGYYNRFIEKWPNVKSLAAAPKQEVYKMWEGLGYYSRCNNLIASAKYIVDELDGKFPDNFDDLLLLKGVGTYTAAAIASFAFNLPHAVVDGNVFRVLARFFGIKTPVDTTEGKKFFTALAADLLDKKEPASYNQALMDFGATICKPALPLCDACPLQKECVAYKKNIINVLPVKEKSVNTRERFFNYLVVTTGDKTYVRQRMDKDIWQNLYEFILIETESQLPEKEITDSPSFKSFFKGNNYEVAKMSKIYKQKLTHQIIKGRFIHVKIKSPAKALKNYEAVSAKELALLPFPKFISSYLAD